MSVLAAIRVIRPGLQTTVQDDGRWGWQAMGVSVSGAMDHLSYRVANALVANLAGAAALEVGFTGPELEFDEARTVAVAGAEFEVSVNGRPVAMHSATMVPAGGCLRFGGRRSGSRAYLAIAGGIDVPAVLGSRSTHLPSRLGGLEGRALMAGDRLRLGPVPTARGSRSTDVGVYVAARVEGTPVLRVLPGRQRHRFVAGAFDLLQRTEYVVGHESNRMGFRLDGARLVHVDTVDGADGADGADILSEITSMGSLQVPGSGQPILLMADRQTTGGYSVIANVITADLPVAGQLAPGDRVRFALCTMEEARAALAEVEQTIAALERSVAS